MGEIIDFAEIRAARQRSRAPGRKELQSAVSIFKQSLAIAALRLREAPPADQEELLIRIERLAALIRYGTRMIGEPVEDTTALPPGQALPPWPSF